MDHRSSIAAILWNNSFPAYQAPTKLLWMKPFKNLTLSSGGITEATKEIPEISSFQLSRDEIIVTVEGLKYDTSE